VAQALATRIPFAHALARSTLDLGLRQGRLLPRYPNPLVLTDDFNPLDVLDVELHENIRKSILETTPAAILLHG
jgi:hypothetical protein